MLATANSTNAIVTQRLFLYMLAMTSVVLTAFAFDIQLQRFAFLQEPPRAVRDLLAALEAFGNGWGVALIVLAVITLEKGRRLQTGRLLTASLGAGIMANVVKMMISRTRPYGVDLEVATVWETFGDWFPFLSAGAVGQSFPSAHTATAFGLAGALAFTYPRGRYLFWSLAIGVGIQRMCVGAHFASDVFIGATLGAAWSYGVCVRGPLSAGFYQLETWWARTFGWSLPANFPTDASSSDTLPITGPRPRVPETPTEKVA